MHADHAYMSDGGNVGGLTPLCVYIYIYIYMYTYIYIYIYIYTHTSRGLAAVHAISMSGSPLMREAMPGQN